MAEEYLRVLPYVLWRLAARHLGHHSLHHHLRGLQPLGIINILFQRCRRRRGRQAPSRKMPPPRSLGSHQHARGLPAHGITLRRITRRGLTARQPVAHRGRHPYLLLAAEHRLLLKAQGLCHHRRVHHCLRLRTAHIGRRCGYRGDREPLAGADDIPTDTLPLVRQTARRRAADERHGRGATQEHHTLQPHVHQRGHHHYRLRNPRMLHHVHRIG